MAEQNDTKALDFLEETPKEVAEEKAVEEKADDKTEVAEVKPEAERPRDTDQNPGFDKVRQQVQQEIANERKRMQAELRAEMLAEVAKAAPKPAKQPDALDGIESDTLSDESDKVLAREMKLLKAQLEETKTLTARQRQEHQAEIARLKAEQERRSFAAENPDLATDYDDILKETADRVNRRFANAEEKVWLTAAEYEYQTVLAERKAKKKAAPIEDKKPSNKPEKDAREASVVRSGAPNPVTNTKKKTLDDLIREGFTD